MGKKVKVELIPGGIPKLLRSQEMQNFLSEQAAAIAKQAGGSVETYVAQTRAVAEVSAEERPGSNKLLKAVKQ